MPTPRALDINWRKKFIGTLHIHVNYWSYRLQVQKYECGKCSRKCEKVMFGLCNEVLEMDVAYLISNASVGNTTREWTVEKIRNLVQEFFGKCPC